MEHWKCLVRPDLDTEFHIFGLIESETDHLPTTKVREFSSKEWQTKADKESAECISFYKQKFVEACNEILAKHGNA